jgi:hypothetical protein
MMAQGKHCGSRKALRLEETAQYCACRPRQQFAQHFLVQLHNSSPAVADSALPPAPNRFISAVGSTVLLQRRETNHDPERWLRERRKRN